MRDIVGNAKTVKELLKGVKYSIEYYQREYKWKTKHVTELVNDLTTKFLEQFDETHERKDVADYPHYFLGSIIISKKDSTNYIVDGQQRLTSLTLLIIFLNNLQKVREESVSIEDLIYSERFGEKSFNLDEEERAPCMEALFENSSFEDSDTSESVKNLCERYEDIRSAFPSDLQTNALPYFIDWLLENVHLVEITAYSDDDAYMIFETMNDRGLSLSPTDMLKGYLLANIKEEYRSDVNAEWKSRIHDLTNLGREVDADFFKTWFRSQYSKKIRERKRNAKQEDFDRIGTEFHRWVRDSRKQIGLCKSSDVLDFIQTDFEFYSQQYLRLLAASDRITIGLEHVGYNAWNGFTLQYMLLLSPLSPENSQEDIDKKIKITARYIDIMLTWRIWNFRSIAYSTMQYAMFLVMRKIRRMEPDQLADTLYNSLKREGENFDNNSPYHRPGIGLYLHQQNKKSIHRILARLTEYIETKSDLTSSFEEYVAYTADPYEVEHVWANNFERDGVEFQHPADFSEHRNRIGGLLLLPKSFNSSYKDCCYSEKLEKYFSQNLLARSLNPSCYEHNPRFIRFISESRLPFQPIEKFTKSSIDLRYELYRQIAKRVWDPESLLREVNK